MKILIIDDERAICEVVASILEAEGFECRIATSGALGLQLAESFCPDLIVCDVTMPEMDGFEILKKVRSHPGLSEVQFVFLTGSSLEHDFRRAMNAGSDDYLTKPFKPNQLVDAVRVRLERSQKISANREREIKEKTKHFYYDELTGLPNRLFLIENQSEILNSLSEKGKICVFLIQIDHIRHINSAFGDGAEQTSLKELAQRLASCLRKETSLFRVDGGSFIALLDGKETCDPYVAAQSFIRELDRPLSYRGHDFHLSASIGASVADRADAKIEPMLLQAEIAMSHVRDSGGRGFSIYNAEMTREAFDRVTLEGALAQALTNGEMHLMYQPQFEIASGRMVGVETLLRWNHPKLGLVSPVNFIPISEESGLILELGRWVLQNSMRFVKELEKEGMPGVHLAVNLSVKQLESGTLVQEVDDLLEQMMFDPRKLSLEVTESILVKKSSFVAEALAYFEKRGITIAIDDFGTGYSSFAYLRQLPVDVLKIDRSFIKDLPLDIRGMQIVASIIMMAHHLKMRVLAEGVETQEQLECLRSLGCEEYQGFLKSPPLTPEDFKKYLLHFASPQPE